MTMHIEKLKSAHVIRSATPTLDDVRVIVTDPSRLLDFLAKNRMSDKFQRQADEHHREVHGLARNVIMAIEGAKNQKDLLDALRCGELTKKADVTVLVLKALIEYTLPRDAQFVSRDTGIQRHLRNHNKDGAEASSFIKDLGGIAATYAAYRAEKLGSEPKAKKARLNLKVEVTEACPGLLPGDLVGVILCVEKSGELKFVKATKITAADFDQATTNEAAADTAVMQLLLPKSSNSTISSSPVC
jgi:hypothetical protein